MSLKYEPSSEPLQPLHTSDLPGASMVHPGEPRVDLVGLLRRAAPTIDPPPPGIDLLQIYLTPLQSQDPQISLAALAPLWSTRESHAWILSASCGEQHPLSTTLLLAGGR